MTTSMTCLLHLYTYKPGTTHVDVHNTYQVAPVMLAINSL